MQDGIDNQTPFVCEPLALTNEEGRPVLALVVKATYVLGPDALRLADEQVPVNVSGEFWGRPEESSYRYEPECAPFKPATDVVLVGHAHATERNTTSLLVSLKVGPRQKSVRVTGERVWFRSLGSIAMTRPLAFEKLPLRYERAFGGWDRAIRIRRATPSRHAIPWGSASARARATSRRACSCPASRSPPSP